MTFKVMLATFKEVAKKLLQKKSKSGLNGIQTHDLMISDAIFLSSTDIFVKLTSRLFQGTYPAVPPTHGPRPIFCETHTMEC